MSGARELRLPALRVQQGPERTLFAFAVDGKLVPQFAAVSRVNRDGTGDVIGYQRPEVRSHIGEIRRYLESPSPMIPNAIVVAFDSSVRFEELENDPSGHGTLIVPLSSAAASEQAAWVVDGQQRLAAIREADVPQFPICVIGFIARDDNEQREQFMLVNSSKPLPKGLIYELLPSTDGRLPSALERRRFPATLLDHLNRDDDSPLKGMVRTPTTPDGVIQDNSMLRMLENSLSDGVLYRLRQGTAATDSEPLDTLLSVVKAFWEATGRVFHEAWQLPPKRSRLTHGAGVVSMGFVMDAISERHRAKPCPETEDFRSDLEGIKEVCRWTDGYWDFGPGLQRKWNEIQNTPNDIQLLSNYLLVQYKARVWARPALAQ